MEVGWFIGSGGCLGGCGGLGFIGRGLVVKGEGGTLNNVLDLVLLKDVKTNYFFNLKF